jgi:hypothetical protein
MAAYIVNGLTFISKEALGAHVQSILRAYRAGESVNEEHAAFLADLLLRHPHADAKIGAGIAGFRVQRIGAFTSTGFVVDRVDGTSEDFSYRQCIRPTTYASKAKFALRRAIADQVIAAKRAVFPDRFTAITCPLSGEPITYSDSHVDHIPPATFAALVQRYLAERDATYDDLPLVPSPDGIGWILEDETAADWAAWHQRHAHLRVVSAAANLKLATDLARGQR